jgi:Flp pilus assembly protein TadB
MSRERARRRAERVAAASRRAADAARRSARAAARRRRRERRRAALRAALPWAPGQRWSRRTRAQRAAVAGVLLAVLLLSWLVASSWTVVVAVGLAALIATPALVTLFLDRSSR